MERYPESWQARLPLAWQNRVAAPRRVESFHEETIPASKWRGYDGDGLLCYYRHEFSLWDEVCDDEEPYRRLVLSEEFEAWRLLDGSWLRLLRRAEGAGLCAGGSYETGFEVVEAKQIPRL
jgi:hypothetical protein